MKKTLIALSLAAAAFGANAYPLVSVHDAARGHVTPDTTVILSSLSGDSIYVSGNVVEDATNRVFKIEVPRSFCEGTQTNTVVTIDNKDLARAKNQGADVNSQAAYGVCNYHYHKLMSQIIVQEAPVQPYIIDQDRHVEFDGLGNCLRSTNWSKELIASVLTISGEPVGQACGDMAIPAPVVAVPADVAPAPEAKHVTIALDLGADVLFGFDHDNLTELGMDKLAQFARDVKALDHVDSINVEAYTDHFGSNAYNQKLSDRRAAVVKSFLVKEGLDAAIISTKGYGESQAAKRGSIKAVAGDRHAKVTAEGTSTK